MAWTRVYTGAEPQRVNRWLAHEGVCSRREAEALITDGLIRIDGEKVMDPGRKIRPGQTLVLGERGQSQLDQKLSVVLNKPVGYVSAQPERDQLPAIRLLRADSRLGEGPAPPNRDSSLAPLGRLDMDSRGLLILSDDGVLAKAIIGPASAIDKEYLVTVRGRITREKILRLRHGLELDGRRLRPARVTREDEQLLRFILTEGRNRQIRRMCELTELDVEDLCRVRIGPVHLGDLPEGRWRGLNFEEREAIIDLSRRNAENPDLSTARET
jgi:23S rRNA pseudouridine2604 synthase